MGIMDWINATDEDDEEEEVVEQVKAPKKEKVKVQPKVTRSVAPIKDCAISIFTPKSYQEASKIGTVLKENKAAIVNVEDLPKEQSKRITDFLQGIVFAIEGNYYVIGEKIILYVPASIAVDDVDGTRDSIEE